MKFAKCTCKSAFQDAEHGQGIRAFNPTAKKPSAKGGHRCTVCGVIHSN
jgi:hypothetical protein